MNKKMLNHVSLDVIIKRSTGTTLNVCSLNVIGGFRRMGNTPRPPQQEGEAPPGYESLMVSEGELLCNDGAIYVLQ